MTRRRATAVAVLVLAGLLVVLTATPASAHVRLTGSSPEQGAHLPALPGEVVLEFSEEVSAPAYVVVTAPDGSRLADGDPVVSGTTVRQPLVDSAVEGEVTIAFRVVSADGHLLTDQLAFSVGVASTASPDAAGGSDPVADDEPSPASAAAAPGGETSRGLALGVPAALLLAAAGLWWLSTRREESPPSR